MAPKWDFLKTPPSGTKLINIVNNSVIYINNAECHLLTFAFYHRINGTRTGTLSNPASHTLCADAPKGTAAQPGDGIELCACDRPAASSWVYSNVDMTLSQAARQGGYPGLCLTMKISAPSPVRALRHLDPSSPPASFACCRGNLTVPWNLYNLGAFNSTSQQTTPRGAGYAITVSYEQDSSVRYSHIMIMMNDNPVSAHPPRCDAVNGVAAATVIGV